MVKEEATDLTQDEIEQIVLTQGALCNHLCADMELVRSNAIRTVAKSCQKNTDLQVRTTEYLKRAAEREDRLNAEL